MNLSRRDAVTGRSAGGRLCRPGRPAGLHYQEKAQGNRRLVVIPDGAAPSSLRLLAAGWHTLAVVLALHGMNDSRDAWEYPAPDFTAAGIAVFSPDLRGFGATTTRALWPGPTV